MFSRGYIVAIVLFWLATASWLVREKILPPLLVGDPPSYRTILAAEAETPEPVAIGWEILLNGNRLGGAVTRTERLPDGIVQLHSRVSLRELPLSELTPAWLTAFVKALDPRMLRSEAIISVQSDSSLDIDPLNRPISFTSLTKIGPPEVENGRHSLLSGLELNVLMKGRIEGESMNVLLHSGEFEYRTRVDLPADALFSDILSPQARLPGLRVGQTWTVPVYSPFRPPNEPVELLQATVERKDPILWNGDIIPALLVVYRGDPGLGLTSNQSARAQMWVDYNGEVVKQEVWLLSSRLLFVRTDPDRAAFANFMPDIDRPLRNPPSGIDSTVYPELPVEAENSP